MKFQEWLDEKFSEQNPGTLDDEWPDKQADWETDLDPTDLIRWAQEWHDKEVEHQMPTM